MAAANFTTTAEMLVIPPMAGTLDGFRRWVEADEFPQKRRATFVAGRLFIELRPEPIEAHVKPKGSISHVIGSLTKELDLGDLYVHGARFSNGPAQLSREPDAMFAPWNALECGRLAPPADRPQDGKHIELTGTPDWVLEIVSDGSFAKDSTYLRRAYHQAGIAEYWLIDARGDAIDLQLLVWTPDQYEAASAQDGWLASPVFGRRFRLLRSRDRLGGWAYDLQHEPVI